MVDPHGEPIRENYRRQGELRAVEKMLDLMNECSFMFTDKPGRWFLDFDELVDVLGEHGTLIENGNGKLSLIRVNPKGL
jgi:hypothetical protein